MSLRAGFARADITPTARCELNGFGARRQPALGIGKPLQVRVLALTSGRTKAIVAVCDLVGLTVADSARLERAIAAATGVAARCILLCCTHTHTGPMSMPLGLIGRYRPAYTNLVEKRLITASRRAMTDLSPVKNFCVGSQPAKSLGFFRCVTDVLDRTNFPGLLWAMHLDRLGTPPIIMMHLGVHPYVLGPAYRRVHPDYPGEICDVAEARTGAHAMMLPGCGADVSPVGGMGKSQRHVEAWADRAAKVISRALISGAKIDLQPLSTASIDPRVKFGFITRREPFRDGEKPSLYVRNSRRWFRELAEGRLPTGSKFPIRVLRLGPLLLVGMPAEIFHDTGADLARAMPRFHVLTVAHSGGNIGYLPRPFAYQRWTYEAGHAYEWYNTAGSVIRGTEAAVRKAALKAIRKSVRAGRV